MESNTDRHGVFTMMPDHTIKIDHLPNLFGPDEECIKNQQLASPAVKPIAASLREDLSVQDLNNVDGYLGIVGSHDNYNPLHHQAVLFRNIIPTQDPRLHLVWFDRTIYIKPLPDCLLNADYFQDTVAKDEALYRLACGFLRSYCRQIRSPLDLTVAKQHHLISDSVTWERWFEFSLAFTTNLNIDDVNIRYRYGELRLARLNIIWRLQGRGLTYFTIHREYNTYFRQYFELFITVFGLATIALTSMQVIVTINSKPAFLDVVCLRFSLAVLLGLATCLAYISIVFLAMAFYNILMAGLAHVYSRPTKKG